MLIPLKRGIAGVFKRKAVQDQDGGGCPQGPAAHGRHPMNNGSSPGPVHYAMSVLERGIPRTNLSRRHCETMTSVSILADWTHVSCVVVAIRRPGAAHWLSATKQRAGIGCYPLLGHFISALIRMYRLGRYWWLLCWGCDGAPAIGRLKTHSAGDITICRSFRYSCLPVGS